MTQHAASGSAGVGRDTPPTVEIAGLSKAYGPTTILRDFDLSVPRGTFLSLLGPSGSGKSTLLRAIAGLEPISGGRVVLDGRVVDDPGRGLFVPPKDRNLGFVFQNYALWPHMTVLDHTLFPLRQKGAGGTRTQRERQAREAIDIVGLRGFEQRFPVELSGGQQQRVSLARAIVARPRLVLLDEPLSNLDTGLRRRLRDEIARTHKVTGATYIYVTHDQEEALALSDLVAVLHEGVLLQLASPAGLFAGPENTIVAEFIGYENVIRSPDPQIWAEALGRSPRARNTPSSAIVFRASDIALVPSDRHTLRLGDFTVTEDVEDGRVHVVPLGLGQTAVRAAVDWPILRQKGGSGRLSAGEKASVWIDPQRIVATRAA